MSEPLVLINLFSMPAEMVDDFVANWETNIAVAGGAKGFRGTRLHRALDPSATYPVVNIARWDSVEDWAATIRQHFVRTERDPNAPCRVRRSGPGRYPPTPTCTGSCTSHQTRRTPPLSHRPSRANMNISLDARGPTHEPGVTRLVAAETIAQWEPGTFLENLAARPDGSWLVTIPSHNRVDLVQPDGRHEVFARLPNHVTGIAADGTAAYVLTGSMRQHDWRLVHVDESAIQTICDLPELAFGNGMARAGDHLLAADSALSHVVSIDPRQGTSSVWLQHELLAGFTPTNPMPGANGITVHNGWVYVSNTGQALLVRCRYDVAEPASQLETVAEQLVADDFDVRSDGRIYLATHFLNTVVRLDPDGTRTTIAGHTQGIVGSTSVALDPSDPT